MMLLCEIIKSFDVFNATYKIIYLACIIVYSQVLLFYLLLEKDQFCTLFMESAICSSLYQGIFIFIFLTDQSSLTFHIPVKMRFKGITFRLAFGNGNMIVRATCSILYRYN